MVWNHFNARGERESLVNNVLCCFLRHKYGIHIKFTVGHLKSIFPKKNFNFYCVLSRRKNITSSRNWCKARGFFCSAKSTFATIWISNFASTAVAPLFLHKTTSTLGNILPEKKGERERKIYTIYSLNALLPPSFHTTNNINIKFRAKKVRGDCE